MPSRRAFNSSDDQPEHVYPNYKSNHGSNNFEYEFSIGLKLILNEISGASLESPPPPSSNKINVVLKSINLSSYSVLIPSSPADQYRHSYCDSNKQLECFLKSCSLCNKLLTSDKDVYMYRGEGFCSIECRTRQIALDEMKEIEEAVKRRKKAPSCSLEPQLSSSDCPAGGSCETCRLLEDVRARRRRRNPPVPRRRR